MRIKPNSSSRTEWRQVVFLSCNAPGTLVKSVCTRSPRVIHDMCPRQHSLERFMSQTKLLPLWCNSFTTKQNSRKLALNKAWSRALQICAKWSSLLLSTCDQAALQKATLSSSRLSTNWQLPAMILSIPISNSMWTPWSSKKSAGWQESVEWSRDSWMKARN